MVNPPCWIPGLSTPSIEPRTHWNGLVQNGHGDALPRTAIHAALVGPPWLGGGVGSGEAPLPVATTLRMRASEEKVEREQLGGKTIAGVYAEGIRITRTIPEGAEGNDRPMIRVDETWRSPELKITLLSINSDPRTGTRTTEVTELDRAEPDPAVFQVPEGYTVKDQTMPGPIVH